MTTAQTIPPWYRQFWPWFIIALPASVVVASIITVIIAFKNADSLVVDNYYKDGLGINRVLAQDQAAKRLALNASVSIDPLVGEVQVLMAGHLQEWPPAIDMQWFHPTNKQQDFSVGLKHTSGNRYIGQLDGVIEQRWYLQLSALQPEPWRLKSEVTLADTISNLGENAANTYQFSLGAPVVKGGDQ